ncbi:MAG: quinoprotein dehydrogenase-associated putative ABC transporter substrate-binding protein [Gammaproteobacteria bacterium]|nr:quinoprotein dehydrogenase-associated putative ABC transporter substrate-binding protein [Gammaproteobacteria bacterium]
MNGAPAETRETAGGWSHAAASPCFLFLAQALFCVLSGSFTTAWAEEQAAPKQLKVCADPYMLPFSNKDEQGYENKIAQLLGSKLGWEVRYEWFPQRMGFIRQTLRAEDQGGTYKCDLVITVPEHFDLAATTDPYFTSTYVLVIARGRGLDDVTAPEMLAKVVAEGRPVKIGLSDQGPAQLWVFRHGLMGNMVPYLGQPGDPKVNPGEVVMRDIASGKIDASIVWGPTAGYFSRELHDQAEFILLPLHNDPKYPDMQFEFSMAMAIRFGEKEWRQKVNDLIHENQQEIDKILQDFGIPLLPLKKSEQRDDDD